MIKQLIGVLVTLGVLAVVVLTVLHHDRYVSMLHFGDPEVSLSAADTLPAPVPTQPADSTAADGLSADGLSADGLSAGRGSADEGAPLVLPAEAPAADSVLAPRPEAPAAAGRAVGNPSDGSEIHGAVPAADGADEATTPSDTVNRQKRPNAPRS